jgi:hypothetical protein
MTHILPFSFPLVGGGQVEDKPRPSSPHPILPHQGGEH